MVYLGTIYASFKPLEEGTKYVKSSLIGCNLTQPYVENRHNNGAKDQFKLYKYHKFYPIIVIL